MHLSLISCAIAVRDIPLHLEFFPKLFDFVMPILTVETNLLACELPPDFAIELTKFAALTLRKPESVSSHSCIRLTFLSLDGSYALRSLKCTYWKQSWQAIEPNWFLFYTFSASNVSFWIVYFT